MLAQSPFEADGTPQRAVYFYQSTEGDAKIEIRGSNSLCRVPDDNGNSWSGSNAPRGATLYVEVAHGADLVEVNQRLHEADANKKRAHKEMQDANAGGKVEETPPEGPPEPLTPVGEPSEPDRPLTNRERKIRDREK